MTGPTGKFGIARRQFLSHRSNSKFDLEGQGAVARQLLCTKAEAPLFYLNVVGSLCTKLMVEKDSRGAT
jgi:hypothetical protein